MKEGLVIKSTGKYYTLKDTSTGDLYNAIIRGKFKLQGLKLTNPVAVGDIVSFSVQEDDIAIIQKIHERTNYVVRQSPRKKHFLHLLASNIDQAVLIVTIVEPKLKQGFIDRFLLMTEPYNIPVHIIFNKYDLYNEDAQGLFLYLKDLYERIDYKVMSTSAIDGTGIDELSEVLKGKTSLIAGQSGVGKSSLINAIIDDIELKTSPLSDYSGKGQHTTTFAEMFDLPQGGSIIDTPGIKTLSFNHLEVMDIAHNFRELFKASSNCKYGDCTHRNEPSCAVKEAVETGDISELRYLNYLQLLEEIENQNYWERIKDY